LLLTLRRRRDKELAAVREALVTVLRRAGSVDAAALQVTDPAALAHLVTEAKPLTGPSGQPSGVWWIRWALDSLGDAVVRFNFLWAGLLQDIDLTHLNALRDGYNRYYVIEKECVVRSRDIALAGFKPLPPLTPADLAREFPPLPVPRLS
jgi:hypothetical protein